MRSFVLVVCVIFFVVCATATLSACRPDKSEVDASSELDDPPDESGAESLVAVSVPTIKPEPIVYVNPSDYVYNKEISSYLDIAMLYPSHWIKETGKNTIVFKQPVNDGEIPARVSVTARKVSKTPSPEKMAELIEDFTEVVGRQYDEFKPGEIFTDGRFLKRPAFYRYYEAEFGGIPVKGYCAITCNSRKKRLYVLHFSVPSSEYDTMDPVIEEITRKDSVIILSH